MRGAQAKMMTFQAAWNLLKQQKPELFNFGNEDATVQLTSAKTVRPGRAPFTPSAHPMRSQSKAAFSPTSSPAKSFLCGCTYDAAR